jgi:hypothetical protein
MAMVIFPLQGKRREERERERERERVNTSLVQMQKMVFGQLL